MSEQVKITVRDNGSLKVQGDFAIVDVEGNEIPHEGDSTGLCRCGHSANKPFCDGSHKEKFRARLRRQNSRSARPLCPAVACAR